MDTQPLPGALFQNPGIGDPDAPPGWSDPETMGVRPRPPSPLSSDQPGTPDDAMDDGEAEPMRPLRTELAEPLEALLDVAAYLGGFHGAMRMQDVMGNRREISAGPDAPPEVDAMTRDLQAWMTLPAWHMHPVRRAISSAFTSSITQGTGFDPYARVDAVRARISQDDGTTPTLADLGHLPDAPFSRAATLLASGYSAEQARDATRLALGQETRARQRNVLRARADEHAGHVDAVAGMLPDALGALDAALGDFRAPEIPAFPTVVATAVPTVNVQRGTTRDARPPAAPAGP